MAHDTPAQGVRFFHQRMHLVLGKGDIFGARPGRELAPPVVAHLITSAPARTIERTTCCTSWIPLATPEGSVGSSTMQQSWPDGLTRSPMPPVGEMMLTASIRRGPEIKPFDGQLKTNVKTSGVAYGGIASGQGLPQYGSCAHMHGTRGSAQPQRCVKA